MEGQTLPDDLRVCSRCRLIKNVTGFYRCGVVSKKTGARYYSSLCKTCHKNSIKEAYHRRNTGQQIELKTPKRPVTQTVLDFGVCETRGGDEDSDYKSDEAPVDAVVMPRGDHHDCEN
jgi:hypothetical protein